MCGCVSETISPSVRSTSRSTPWVLGCCGPMLTSISSVRTSNSTTVGSGRRTSVTVAIDCLSPSNSVIFQREFVILPQRMSDPVLRQENPPRIRMVDEPHAAQVVDFSLVPVGDAPDIRHGRHLGQFADLVALPARQDHLEREPVLVRKALEVIDDLHVWVETGLWRLLGVRFEIVEAADVGEHVESQRMVGLKKSADVVQGSVLDVDERVDRVRLFGLDFASELVIQGGADFGGSHR